MGASWESLQELSYQDTAQGKWAVSSEVVNKLSWAFLGSQLGAEGAVGHVPLSGAAWAQLNTALL